MFPRDSARYLRRVILGFASLALIPVLAFAADEVRVTDVTATVVVFSTDAGNVVASVGPDGALLVGTPSASSTDRISQILASRTKSPFRYVVIWPEPESRWQGDAGWLKRGAFVAMHENALRRLGGAQMGAPHALPARLAELGVERPPMAFSEVLAFDLNGDAIHVVHQKAGYSDADAIAHFHVSHLVYLGEVFPGDGYPQIDQMQGGTLDGLLHTLGSWAGGTIRVVPARGNVSDAGEVKAYYDMIATVRDRVGAMLKTGKTENQIIAAHPTADFDSRWGQGRVSANDFVHEVYASLAEQK
jgi:cyclase